MSKVFLAYLLTALIAFANGLSGSFMLDDHAFFTSEIKNIQYLPRHFIPKTYKSSSNSMVPHGQPNFYYRPFAKVLPSIAYVLFGQKVFLYHLMNLVLLVIAGFLIFRFLSGAGILGHRGSFVAGLFYIIHPINGVMVNYITASVFSLQVIFMIISLILLQGRQRPSVPASQKNNGWGTGYLENWGTLSFFLLALLCHETALLLPVYASFFVYARDQAGSVRQKFFVSLRRTWFLWISAVVWLIFRFYYASLGDGLIAKFARFEMNPFEYAASVGKLTVWYLSKLIIPWDIVLIWATPVVRGDEALMWLTFGSLILGLWVFGLGWIKDKAIRLGLWWLATGFLPLPLMCLFQPTHGPMIEPHWFVFSVIGFIMCIAYLLETAPVIFGKPGMVIVLVVFLVSGWRHNHLWADEKRYAQYWSEISPSNKSVWFHRGEICFKERQFTDAAVFYERSIRNTYQDYLAYQRMGLSYFQLEDYRRAEVNFMLSLGLEPRQPGIKERLKWIARYAR